jgi:signal transduction histidine kinase
VELNRWFDRQSLQLEIVLNLAAVMSAGLATVAVVCVGLSVRTVELETVDRLRLEARHIRRVSLGERTRLTDLAAFARTVDPALGAGTWRVVDRAGGAVWRGGPGGSFDGVGAMVDEAWIRGEAVRGGLVERSDLSLVLPIRTGRGEEGALVATVPIGDLWLRVRPLVAAAAWVLGITAFVFVGFGAWLLRRRIVFPIREIARASAAIAEGRFSTRVETNGSSELLELGEHFNHMAGSLERERGALVEAERSLARGERLASVGRLAAGVAHEVGNPVSAILGFTEVGLADPGTSPRTREALEGLRTEATRIRALLRELLDLSRAEEVRPKIHDVEGLVRPVVGRLGLRSWAGDIEIELVIPDDLPAVRTDGGRVEQILLNLLENGIQAAKPGPSPRLEIQARCEPDAFGTPGRRRGDPRSAMGVALDVIDNGPGIAPEDLSRVFDPFFTTKEPGAGTGLGLWNAHRLAELLGARIEVESEPGRTRFSLLLPTADTGDHDAGTSPPDRG